MIEKVHGLQATNISLNDRFTLLTNTAPAARVARPRRRSSGMYSLNQNANRLLIEQIAQRLGQQSKRYAVQQRLGLTGFRRFGSEGNLSGLQRYNSFSNLNSIKNRAPWRQSNGNISRASFQNASTSPWRGRWYKRRGGGMGFTRGMFRGRGGRQQLIGRLRNQQGNQRGRGRGRGRGRAWGAARGAARGQHTQKQVLTKEELDLELDQYMASTKTAQDRE